MRVKVAMVDKDHRYVNKPIDYIKVNGNDAFSGTLLKGTTDIERPVLILSINRVHPMAYNYVKMYWGASDWEPQAEDSEVWTRCYFVESYKVDGNIVYLQLQEDYAYTFRVWLLNLECNVIRQEFKGSPYIPDDRILCSTKRQLNQYNASSTPFVTSGTGNPVVLTVSGGNS